jgi:hypothetical protein
LNEVPQAAHHSLLANAPSAGAPQLDDEGEVGQGQQGEDGSVDDVHVLI